jgi:hypothetical protein
LFVCSFPLPWTINEQKISGRRHRLFLIGAIRRKGTGGFGEDSGWTWGCPSKWDARQQRYLRNLGRRQAQLQR